MEQALSEVCKDVRIGKILIQNNIETGEPEVIFSDNDLETNSIIYTYFPFFSCIICGFLVTLKTIWSY